MSPVLRQWLVLAMLPRAPRGIDTGTLEARLRDRGLVVHRRTVQRDLVELATLFPIDADERSKPYTWRWSPDATARGFFARELPAAPPIVGPSIEVILGPSAALAELLERLGARVRHGPSQVVATIEDSAHSRRLLLGHADVVEVLSPPALRQELVTRAQRIFERHRKE